MHAYCVIMSLYHMKYSTYVCVKIDYTMTLFLEQVNVPKKFKFPPYLKIQEYT